MDLIQVDRSVCKPRRLAATPSTEWLREARRNSVRADAAIDLRCDQDILAGDIKVLQGLPWNVFALTLRIIVRGIKEVDAGVNRRPDPFICPSLVKGADSLEKPVLIPNVMVPKSRVSKPGGPYR